MTRNFARKSILTLIILSMIVIGPMAMASNFASIGGTELPESATPMPTTPSPAAPVFDGVIESLVHLTLFFYWR